MRKQSVRESAHVLAHWFVDLGRPLLHRVRRERRTRLDSCLPRTSEGNASEANEGRRMTSMAVAHKDDSRTGIGDDQTLAAPPALVRQFCHAACAVFLALTVACGISTAHSEVLYSFRSDVLFSEPFGLRSERFTLSTPSFITDNALFSGSSLTDCVYRSGSNNLACGGVTFIAKPTPSPVPGIVLPAGTLQTHKLSPGGGGGTTYYYFSAAAFSTPGDHRSSVNNGFLSVTLIDTPPPPPPSIAPFGPIDVPFRMVGDHGAPGYSISFMNSAFTVDFPIYLDSTADSTSIRILSLLDGWVATINDLWSSREVVDQYGRSYPFSFNARLTNDRTVSLTTLRLHDVVGSDNAACRSDGSREAALSSGVSYDLVFADCPIPSVYENVMYMPTSLQSFCLDGKCEPSRIVECRGLDGTAVPLSICEDLNGDYLRRVAAHEFGHLLGLPDEYPPSGDRERLCIEAPNLGLDCTDDGLMYRIRFDPVDRYFEYLFSNLDTLTPGFELSFVPDPDWISPSPLPNREGLFEISPDVASATVRSPSTLLLLEIGCLSLILYTVVRRRLGSRLPI